MFLKVRPGRRWRQSRIPSSRSLPNCCPWSPLEAELHRQQRNTVSGAFLRWKTWATLKYGSQTCLPVKPLHVALYLTYLIQKSSTSAPVEEASNAISWAHQLAATDDPTQNDIVKQVVAGAMRILAHRTTKKEPITPEIVEKASGKICTGEGRP